MYTCIRVSSHCFPNEQLLFEQYEAGEGEESMASNNQSISLSSPSFPFPLPPSSSLFSFFPPLSPPFPSPSPRPSSFLSPKDASESQQLQAEMEELRRQEDEFRKKEEELAKKERVRNDIMIVI